MVVGVVLVLSGGLLRAGAEDGAARTLVHGILFCFLLRGAAIPEILVPVFDKFTAVGGLKVINTLQVGLFC